MPVRDAVFTQLLEAQWRCGRLACVGLDPVDAKRGDIASTNLAYRDAPCSATPSLSPESDLRADPSARSSEPVRTRAVD